MADIKYRRVGLRLRIVIWEGRNAPFRQWYPDGLYETEMKVPDNLAQNLHQVRLDLERVYLPDTEVDDIKLLD